MTRVVCVGDVMVDVLAQLTAELAVGSDTPSPVSLLGGGSAANTAAWLVRAGQPATFVGRVGDDALGRQAIAELRNAGVDVAVTVDAALVTGVCIVLVAPDGERTMVPSAGANAVGGTVPALERGMHLHVSGYALFHARSHDAAVAALHSARAAGCTVSVDAASAAPLALFGAERFIADTAPCLLFANLDEAVVLTGGTSASDALAEMAVRKLGSRCGEAIVKLGPAGALWSDGMESRRYPVTEMTACDSTGAGDAFAAGVLAARLSGADLDDTLSAGNRLAATAIAQRGARPR